MVAVKISPKGQLIIPADLRQALHLQAGERLLMHVEGEKLVLEREDQGTTQLVTGHQGRRVLKAPASAPPMTTERVNALLEESA